MLPVLFTYRNKKVLAYGVYLTALGYNYYSKNLQYQKLKTSVYILCVDLIITRYSCGVNMLCGEVRQSW
jgi:hypothetical protein